MLVCVLLFVVASACVWHLLALAVRSCFRDVSVVGRLVLQDRPIGHEPQAASGVGRFHRLSACGCGYGGGYGGMCEEMNVEEIKKYDIVWQRRLGLFGSIGEESG